MQVADFPHLADKDRRRVHKLLHRLAHLGTYADAETTIRLHPLRDRATLAGMGIGVRVGED